VLNSIQKKIEGTNDPKKIQEADFVIMVLHTPVTRLTDTGMDPVEPVPKITDMINSRSIFGRITRNISLDKHNDLIFLSSYEY